jgi:GH15 family glucan-1,4-alpha-glucosidase
MTATYDRITRELSKNELVWRSPVAEDDPMGAEHAFGICGFWAVDYLAQSGRLHEASQRFERLLEHSNDVGLFGEEMDGSTGEPRGNFPQGFTHTGLIIAAQSIATAQRA